MIIAGAPLQSDARTPDLSAGSSGSGFPLRQQMKRGYGNILDIQQLPKLPVLKARHGLPLHLERLCAEKRWASGNVPDKNETTCSGIFL